MRVSLVTSFLFSGLLASRATELLLWFRPGGPMQYNGHGPIFTDNGVTSLVSANFDLPQAVRIESVRAWINGLDGGDAFVSIQPVPNIWDKPLSHSIPLEQVLDAPAKWQGVDSLNWSLGAGTYTIFIQALDIPYSLGYLGPDLHPAYDLYDFHDYSESSEPFGFGLQVYGSQLSAIPEPSLYGLMGGVVLIGIVARRRFGRTTA